MKLCSRREPEWLGQTSPTWKFGHQGEFGRGREQREAPSSALMWGAVPLIAEGFAMDSYQAFEIGPTQVAFTACIISNISIPQYLCNWSCLFAYANLTFSSRQDGPHPHMVHFDVACKHLLAPWPASASLVPVSTIDRSSEYVVRVLVLTRYIYRYDIKHWYTRDVCPMLLIDLH